MKKVMIMGFYHAQRAKEILKELIAEYGNEKMTHKDEIQLQCHPHFSLMVSLFMGMNILKFLLYEYGSV